MTAKSIVDSCIANRPADALPRVRQLLTLVLVLTSLSTLVVLLEERLGSRFVADALAMVRHEATTMAARVLPRVQPEVMPAENERHVALAEFLARRYKVAQDLTLDFVRIAHAEAARVGLDPLLIMAVIAVESRFNPIAESVMGARGLMQIIPRFHADKLAAFGGERAVFEPEANIRVGTRILREYLTRTGNLGIALQMYAGALNDDNDTYTTRVLGEKQRLQQVVATLAEPAAGTTRVSQRRERKPEMPLGERI
jgi:hypothetical protein